MDQNNGSTISNAQNAAITISDGSPMRAKVHKATQNAALCMFKLESAATVQSKEKYLWLAVLEQALRDSKRKLSPTANNTVRVTHEQTIAFFKLRQYHPIINLLGIDTNYADRLIKAVQ